MNMKILSELGLSDREIAVYLALIRLSPTTTGPLVRASKVTNAKIYETLGKLIDKGLASYIYRGRIKYFQSADPETLLNFLDEKRAAVKDMVKSLKTIQQKGQPECEVRVYEGIRAIKSVLYEMYDRNAEYCVFPIGEEPDNKSWSGFQFYNSDEKSGYITIFRELNNKENKKDVRLKFAAGKKIRLINLQTGKILNAKVSKEGNVTFRIDVPASFRFYKYEFNTCED